MGAGLAYDRAIARRKAGGVTVFVTGDKQIDAALRRFSNKLQRKYLQDAGKKAAKTALSDYQKHVPVASGAMRDAAKVLVAKFGRRAKQKGVGARLVIDRKKLFRLYEARTGRKPGKRKVDSEPFFYPSVVEFGDADTTAQRPLRKSVFDNDVKLRNIFLVEIRKALAIAP